MKTMFQDFLCALGFISILPAGKEVRWSPIGMIKFFPVIGLILGGLLVAFDAVASLFFPGAVVAVIDVIFLLSLTGAFHIDGLGDAADGIFSHRPKERVMEIMKDSRIGMMGLVAVFSVLAIKIAGVYCVKTASTSFQIPGILLIVPSYARASMLLGIRFLKYGRKGTGTGLDLFERPLGFKDFSFVWIPLVISLFLGYKGLVLNAVFAVSVAGILIFYKRKLNCITGDMLGAMTEIVEALLFLAAGAVLL
ncbi:MAG: adenosylcobinamide-GDP ribazoletransferase [Desulfobacula sp.]|nr:adenosylcobinamide-GDP ribazoletransferase [Desulfobacula sp.]